MRAFYHPDQSLHDPQQYMRFGQIVAPKDLPERTAQLLGALARHGVTPEQPADTRAASPILGVHSEGFVTFLRDRLAALARTARARARGLAQHLPLLERPHRRGDAARLPPDRADGPARLVSRRSLGAGRRALLDLDPALGRRRRWPGPMRCSAGERGGLCALPPLGPPCPRRPRLRLLLRQQHGHRRPAPAPVASARSRSSMSMPITATARSRSSTAATTC